MAGRPVAVSYTHLDVYKRQTDKNYAKPNYSSAFCKPTTVNIVRLPSQDKATLQTQIGALQAGGNTSIMLGMKWGTRCV